MPHIQPVMTRPDFLVPFFGVVEANERIFLEQGITNGQLLAYHRKLIKEKYKFDYIIAPVEHHLRLRRGLWRLGYERVERIGTVELWKALQVGRERQEEG